MKQILLLTYLLGLSLFAQEQVYTIQESNGQLYEYAQFADAGNLDLNIHQVIEDDTILTYNNLESDNHSLGFTSNNYWVKFQLRNNDKAAQTYYLETGRPITDVVNLYQINNGTISTFKNGDKMPFKNKQVQHRSTVFEITLPPQKAQQIYLQLTSDGETINLPLHLYTETEFWLMNYKQQLFLGLFYGLLALASIIYLFFYTSLKENAFLYYGLYVLSIGLMQASLDGLIHEYILTSGGYFNDRAVLITALCSNLFLLKYCEYFLKIKEHLKGLVKAFKVAYVLIGISFALLFINKTTLEIAYPFSNVNGLFSLVLILITSFTLRVKRIKIDAFFSIGIFFLVIGLLGFVMNNLSLLPNNFYTLNSAKFGSGFEVIFLSLSMTNLIRKLRLEKEVSQEETLVKTQEISELKTYFMSNMSHELRTPINAIMGIAESELETLKNNKDRKPYEVIKNASLSLLSHVNDIIDFEKIEKNQLQLSDTEFNPSIKLNQISNSWKAEADKKGLQYKFELDPEIPTHVIADETRFIQIINNVLSNAIKFTESGSVYFKVNCLKQPDDLCRFSFQISDTGVGITPETKKTIFDSFSQMKNNHKRQFGGIGLGLTIVKRIIELFNGSIKIESKVNKGTDVFIDLTLKSIAKERVLEFPESNNIPLHVLVVEDNKLNQMVMRKILGMQPNITFAIANNGQEALDTLKKDVYDLVLMDLQMPVMDGYEATEIIRKGGLGSKTNNIPIIAITADAMPETKNKVFSLGMNDYMTKPIDKTLLLEKIYACNHKKTAEKKLKIA